MTKLIEVFHGTRAVRAAMDIANKNSDLLHAYKTGNPTPNLSTAIEDAWAHAVGGVVLGFAVPQDMLEVVGMADPNNPVKWYVPIARVSREEYKNLPHDFRQYLADPLRFIKATDVAAPGRWPQDLIITVLSSAYFAKLHFS